MRMIENKNDMGQIWYDLRYFISFTRTVEKRVLQKMFGFLYCYYIQR